MCGIGGIFGFEDKGLLKRMSKLMQYRGPDDHGIYTDGKIGLVHRRLSIIDLSKNGKQPMSNEDGSVWLTYNGEIYNFKELRSDLEHKGHTFCSKTDSEVLVHGYEEYGIDFVSKLNGQFAFAIWDANKKCLYLVRDRLGIKPLFYFYENGRAVFASAIKSINLCKKFEIDKKMLDNYLAYGYNRNQCTLLHGIKKVPPGGIVRINSKGMEVTKFWDLHINEKKINLRAAKGRLLSLLKDSVQKRLISDVPLGVYLSGGIDSSSVVALMSELTDDIKTYSVGFGDHYENELGYARLVADNFNTNHTEVIVEPGDVDNMQELMYYADEPISDMAMVPVAMMSKHAKKDVKVVLTGEGNDEIWGGYSHYKRQNMLCGFGKIPLLSSSIKAMSPCFSDSTIRYRLMYMSELMKRRKRYATFNRVFDPTERVKLGLKERHSSEGMGVSGVFKNGSFLNQMSMCDTKTLLPDCYLVKADRMTMAYGIESRVPLIDHRIAEMAFSVPTSMKFCERKYIFKKAVKNVLPNIIVNRKKRGFMVPGHVWQDRLGLDYFSSILDRQTIRDRGLFKYSQVQDLIRKSKNQSMREANRLWSLVALELWQRSLDD